MTKKTEEYLKRILEQRGFFRNRDRMKELGHTIRGGHIVIRRGVTDGQLRPSMTPMEYPSSDAAEEELERLKEREPGVEFEVWSQKK